MNKKQEKSNKAQKIYVIKYEKKKCDDGMCVLVHKDQKYWYDKDVAEEIMQKAIESKKFNSCDLSIVQLWKLSS